MIDFINKSRGNIQVLEIKQLMITPHVWPIVPVASNLKNVENVDVDNRGMTMAMYHVHNSTYIKLSQNLGLFL